MVGSDGSVIMTGNNVGELSPDGRFLSMTGFVGSVDDAGARLKTDAGASRLLHGRANRWLEQESILRE